MRATPLAAAWPRRAATCSKGSGATAGATTPASLRTPACTRGSFDDHVSPSRVPRLLPLVASLRILGIDPGLGVTGYGVVEKSGSALCYVASGRIRSRES